MNAPLIHGKGRVLSASSVLEALGNDLLKIKIEDNLRWSDIGEVLGKSEDQAAKYADASAAMDVVAYARGKAAWNGRFTGTLDKMLERVRGETCPQKAQTLILLASVALSSALEDGALTVAEIHANRSTLENARDAIDAQLAKLKPQGVSA